MLCQVVEPPVTVGLVGGSVDAGRTGGEREVRRPVRRVAGVVDRPEADERFALGGHGRELPEAGDDQLVPPLIEVWYS